MKKYRFISPIKKKELETKAAVHRKKWKAKMFLQSGSYFDNPNPKLGWRGSAETIKMPQSKEDVKKYFDKFRLEEYEVLLKSDSVSLRKSLLEEEQKYQEICSLPENVQIYIAGLDYAITSCAIMPWGEILSKYFYTQHEWDLFLILNMLMKTSGIHSDNDDVPWPLYWFKSKELLFETLHLYPELIKNSWSGRALPLRSWDQKDFIKEIVEVNYELFRWAPKKIKECKENVLKAAKVDGRIIRFIKTRLRNDPEVAMTAINSHADAKDFLFKKTRDELGLI